MQVISWGSYTQKSTCRKCPGDKKRAKHAKCTCGNVRVVNVLRIKWACTCKMYIQQCICSECPGDPTRAYMQNAHVGMYMQ